MSDPGDYYDRKHEEAARLLAAIAEEKMQPCGSCRLNPAPCPICGGSGIGGSYTVLQGLRRRLDTAQYVGD